MHNFKTKQEQVDASIHFVLGDNPDYMQALGNRPARVQAALVRIVVDWPEPSGYHFNVLRAAQRQYSRGDGLIAAEEPPYTHEELHA